MVRKRCEELQRKRKWCKGLRVKRNVGKGDEIGRGGKRKRCGR